MPITIVVGGQYGSEGKGKVSAYLSREMKATAVVRCGGSNSGHTVYDDNKNKYVLRHLPTSAIYGDVNCYLVAGTYIDVDVLMSEIKITKICKDRLFIDPYTMLILDSHKEQEKKLLLNERIGSTASGTGAAVCERILRKDNVLFAKDHPLLKDYVNDTKENLRKALMRNERIIVEGTQGYGLSVLHSKDYPFVTSRDTTAAGFISECGLSPLDVDDIALVIRTYPIRVAGNSGDMKREVSWKEVARNAHLDIDYVEYTTVTKKVRRVAEFDECIVKEAITSNKPTRIVLNHLDYIDERQRSEFVFSIERKIDKKIEYVGVDPFSLQGREKLLESKLVAI